MYITSPSPALHALPLTPPPHTHPRRTAALVSSHIGIFLSALVALCACIIALYWLQACFHRHPRRPLRTTTTPLPRFWPFHHRARDEAKWPRHHIRSCSNASDSPCAYATRPPPPPHQMTWWERDAEAAIEMEGTSRERFPSFIPFVRRPARAGRRAGRRRREGDGAALTRWALVAAPEEGGGGGEGRPPNPPPSYEDSGRDELRDAGSVPGYNCGR